MSLLIYSESCLFVLGFEHVHSRTKLASTRQNGAAVCFSCVISFRTNVFGSQRCRFTSFGMMQSTVGFFHTFLKLVEIGLAACLPLRFFRVGWFVKGGCFFYEATHTPAQGPRLANAESWKPPSSHLSSKLAVQSTGRVRLWPEHNSNHDGKCWRGQQP